MAILDSVNIGTPQAISAKEGRTGIFKLPVSGPVVVSQHSLEGDAVMDLKHHGGPDQAVYIYFADDYRWWRGELGEVTAPGLFGENFTISGVEGRMVAVGDRFRIGDVLLEVTAHRTPCAIFAARMGDPKWVQRFHRAGRPGAYCRVITPGTTVAMAAVEYLPYAGERITVGQLMALDGTRERDPSFMRRALTVPLHYKMRADYEQRLARLF